ncbi:hypothetical protein MCAL106L_0478 [Mycoplasmopsis californica]|uniref:MHO_4530 family protein n=1 Tax=Mycoplasmopsis californica TaxID=2113 RepID=UPI000EB6D569|nr:hypothetical protein [Mycoplasmopsis californica]BBG40908.1 hypothetical protein MCAL106_0478 [Mycoplasmopsis californica]BBG41502.1 hypothetical protein MCAL106E_0478 [Mycoplasmopsis californica]BBG42095.1 hypothetical protein MCAL106L_0478 [Mycoplasmopsis californica]
MPSNPSSPNSNSNEIKQAIFIDSFAVITFILFAIFLAFCLIFASFIALRHKKTAYHGMSIFKINVKEKWAIRVSPIKLSFYHSIDHGKHALSENKFYHIEEFLSYFDNNSASEIRNVLQSNVTNKRFRFLATLNRKHTNTSIQSFLNHLINLEVDNSPLNVRIIGKNSDDSFYITINWRNNFHDSKIFANKIECHDINEIIEFRKFKYLGVIAIKTRVKNIGKHVSDNEIKQVYEILNLNKNKWKYIHENEIIYLINPFIKNNLALKTIMKKLHKKVIEITPLLPFNDLVKKIVFSYTKPANNQSDIEYIQTLAKYLLVNDDITFGQKHSSHDHIGSLDKAKLDLFKVKLVDFESKIHASSFIKNDAVVSELSQKPTNMSVALAKVAGINQDDINKFKFLHQYNLELDEALVKYHLDSIQTDKELFIHTTDLCLFKNVDTFSKYSANYILHTYDNENDFDIIQKLLQIIETQKAKIGLYITDISTRLIQFLHSNKIDKFIISSKLASQITTNTDVFLQILHFSQFLRKNSNATILWENVPEKINSYYAKKLNIKYTYKNQYL